MKLGWWIILVAAIYGFLSTRFFGYNALPQSFEELVADGITLIIWAIGFLTLAVEGE